MACKTCDELLTAYQRLVRVFVNADRSFQGLLGDDFQRPWKELERLRQTCRGANAALLAHWRQDHSNRTKI
jgi:hypothetical protein